MSQRFEDLYRTASGDGAFSPIFFDTSLKPTSNEVEELLSAWYSECTQKIESVLLLEEARKLLSSLGSESHLSSKRKKQIGRLLRSIQDLQNSRMDTENKS